MFVEDGFVLFMVLVSHGCDSSRIRGSLPLHGAVVSRHALVGLSGVSRFLRCLERRKLSKIAGSPVSPFVRETTFSGGENEQKDIHEQSAGIPSSFNARLSEVAARLLALAVESKGSEEVASGDKKDGATILILVGTGLWSL